jgi:hypothetical protein
MTSETSNEFKVLSGGSPDPSSDKLYFPDMLTLGDENNSFVVQYCDLPAGMQMTMQPPNILQINKDTTPTQRSLLMMRFIVNMTYRIGKVSGAVQNELTEAEIDGMTVGIWQWLGTSGMLSTVTPPMLVEWLAKTRMEIAAMQAPPQ